MKQLNDFVRKLRLKQILTICLAGVLLLISTACNSGDVRGARPNNPPVQAGGANNPYKQGGDNNTQYRMSPDPNASSYIPNLDRQRAEDSPSIRVAMRTE